MSAISTLVETAVTAAKDRDELRARLAKIDEVLELWRTGIYSAQEAILTIESRRQGAVAQEAKK